MRRPQFMIASLALVLCLLVSAGKAMAGDNKTILVSLEFTEVLSKALVQHTDIRVKRIIPPVYPPAGHQSYLKKHWDRFAPLAHNADAVIYASTFWTEDPLYANARRANIRIVPVDISRPLDNHHAGIPVTERVKESGSFHYIWTSPGNCARMSDILAADLSQLFPESSAAIQKNLVELKRALFKIRTKYEIALGKLDAFEAIGFTTDFVYLTDEFGIDMVKLLLTPEHKITDKQLADLQDTITSLGVHTVLAKWQPKESIVEAVQAAGAEVVVLSHFKARELPPAEQLVDYYQHNLDLLLKSLSQ